MKGEDAMETDGRLDDRKVKMVDCPVTEGAIAAAVVAAGGASLEEVVQVAQASKEQAKS